MTETQRKWPDFVSQRDIIAQHEAAVSMLMEEIKRLEAEVESLKCCGNCKHFGIDDQHSVYCENDVYPFSVIGKCDKWEEQK